MQTQSTSAQPPVRPATSLSPLAEIVLAVSFEFFGAGNGGKPGAFEDARASALAQFADIGVSADNLRRFARGILA